MKRYLIFALLLEASLIMGCMKDKEEDKTSADSPKKASEQQAVFCTQEVKQCPDGSFVSRDSNNNCKFKPCP